VIVGNRVHRVGAGRMFRGVAQIGIDEKGRMAIPARFRDVLASFGDDTLVVTVNPSRCLMAFPLSQWTAIENRVADLGMSSKAVEAFERFYVANAVDVTPDKQGRILIPPPLRKFASLDGEAIVSGRLKKFEIWTPAQWEAQQEQNMAVLAEAGPELAALGL